MTTGYLWDGRRLTGINYYNDSNVDIEYRYNDQGVRVSKETNTHEYEYIVDGYLVLVEIIDGTNYIYYTYDVDGTLISMNYQGVEYYYISNLQGDIIGMMDGSGNIVVKYSYDAWGNIVYQWTLITNLDHINPYRYRGYRYDVETNLYYLNARYYDPSIARFISADDVSFISDDQAASINLYAYSLNNPVMYSDFSGNMPEWLENTLVIGGVALLIAGIAMAALFTGGLAGAALMAVAFSTGIGAYNGLTTAIEDGTSIAAGVLSGGLKGLATGVAIGLGIMTGGGAFSALGGLAAFGGSLAVNFGAGIGCYAIDSKMNNRGFSWNSAINNGFKQMASGAFAFAAGGLIGVSGFYNIPGQTKMFSSQWFGNIASGLLLKAVYYYGIDTTIRMI